jgi:hypothetical protein
MKLGTIFSPVHQRHQQLVCSAQLGRSPKIGHLRFQHANHLSESMVFDSRQPLEVFIASFFDLCISYVPIMAQLQLMQEVY